MINITSTKGWLNAGVLRCNETNPCKRIHLENIHITGWDSDSYTCSAIQGYCRNCTPVPSCIVPDPEEEEETVVDY